MNKLFGITALTLGITLAAPAAAGLRPGFDEVGRPYRYQQPHNPNPRTATSGSPKSPLTIQRFEGKVVSIDLNERTLTIESKTGELLTLGFMVPAGSEKIKTAKKAARALGKKAVGLDELRRATEVKLSYYAALESVETIIVTRPVLTEDTVLAD